MKEISEFPAASLHSLEKTVKFDLIKQLKLTSLTLQVSIYVFDICGCNLDAQEKKSCLYVPHTEIFEMGHKDILF